MTLGERLKAWRGGRSQTAVAEELGISQETWSRYEQGKQVPRAAAMQRLINATAGTRYALKLDHFADAECRNTAARTGTGG